MDSSNQSSTTIITIAEIFLLFLVGILGNEIAEVLDISPFTLFILTGIVLVFLSILSYVKSKNISVEQLRNVLFLGVKRIFPRTMISVIPMGALMGWIIGAGSSLLFLDMPLLTVPVWVSSFTNTSIDFAMRFDEPIALIVGALLGIFIAIFVDEYLSLAFLIGYSISLPAYMISTMRLYLSPGYLLASIFITYTTYFLFFIATGILIILTLPMLRRLRKVLTEPRV